MEILALSCIHNDIENMFNLLDQAGRHKFDVVVFPGDFSDLNVPKGFTRLDISKIIVSELQGLGKPLITVPGSWDKEIIGYLDEKGISVHGRGIVVDGVGFYGYGGARTPFNTPFEPSEGEIELGLIKGYGEVRDEEMKVQVTHMPPAGTEVDRIFSGAHVGSEIVRKFVRDKKPNVAVCAHIHEAKGIDELGETKLVNPGRFPEGNCAIISLERSSVDARMISLSQEIKKSV